MTLETIRQRLEALSEDTGWQQTTTGGVEPLTGLYGLASVQGGDGDGVCVVFGNAAHGADAVARAAFIASARQDIPALVRLADAAAETLRLFHRTGVTSASPEDHMAFGASLAVLERAVRALGELP